MDMKYQPFRFGKIHCMSYITEKMNLYLQVFGYCLITSHAAQYLAATAW